MQERNVVSVILLTIFTCGIYALYWMVVTTNEIEYEIKEKDSSCTSGGMCLLLTIITCGIYGIYWYYKQGQRVHTLLREHNLSGNDNSVLYLILAIFQLSIVSDALIQSDLNRIINAKANADRRIHSDHYDY